VFRLAFAILGNEADARDASQEALVAVWRGIRGLRDADRLDAWLQRTVVHAARQLIRTGKRRRAREIPASDVVDLGSAEAQPHRDDAAVLDAALATLPIDQRSILVLHHLEHRSLAQIAEVLGIPAGTAKSRLFAARRALAAAITRENAS
jgi:RNA polymerase sigma-70 factor (ECF subfamily)